MRSIQKKVHIVAAIPLLQLCLKVMCFLRKPRHWLLQWNLAERRCMKMNKPPVLLRLQAEHTARTMSTLEMQKVQAVCLQSKPVHRLR